MPPCAHQTLTARYGIRWRPIFSNHKRHKWWYEVFQVVSVSRPPAPHRYAAKLSQYPGCI